MFSRLSNSWKIALQLVFVTTICALAAFILISLGVLDRNSGSHRVQFQVEASGAVAIITLQAGDVSISEPTTVSAPWSKTIDIPSGTEVYLTALNPTQTGQLSCSITLDNKPWKSDTTSAPKDGVACAGIVP
jgi:hypothetical protein